MSRPLVSVIIPAYNVEDFIGQCMDSVLNQTLKEIEVICVDDGSTDGTLEILREYEKKDSRVKVLTQANGGAGTARNTGLREAKGETLSFLDSDDFFEPEMLESAYRKYQETKAQIVAFDSDLYFEDTKEFRPARQINHDALPPYEPFCRRSFTANSLRVFIGWAWDKLFDAEFVRKEGLEFQALRTTNDMYFVFSAIILAERIAVVKKVLAHHRKNVSSSLSNTREKSWNCFYQALLKVRQTMTDHGLYYEMEQDFVNYALHACFWNLDSLKGEPKRKLFEMLKTEGFRELGMTGKPKAYFDIEGDYQKMVRVTELSFEQYTAGPAAGKA